MRVRPDGAPDQRPAAKPVASTALPASQPVRELAQQIAAALLPLADEPVLQRRMLVAMARSLRQELTREPEPEPTSAAAPSAPLRQRGARELARAIDATAAHNEPAALVADLRVFARLTLGECADLLQCPRALLRQIWRSTRRSLFATVRQALRLPARRPPRSAS